MRKILIVFLVLFNCYANAQFSVSLSSTPSSITAPTSQVLLTADLTNTSGQTPFRYVFTKTSGPTAGVITNSSQKVYNTNDVTTTVTGMVPGTYRFRVTVKDRWNTYSRTKTSSVTVVVSGTPPTPPTPPVANAGNDTTIDGNTANLSGSGTGGSLSFLWTKISGSTTGAVTSPTSQNTTAGGLIAGTYKFMLRVSNANGSDTDTMQVTVNSSPSLGTFYFSSSLGDDSRTPIQAQSSATPWRTLTKLNSYFSSLTTGQTVSFKRGDSFYGSIVPTQGGIKFTAYGSGANPIITGFTTISSWTPLGSNLYEASVSSATPIQIVSIGGNLTAMGRYPNNNGIANKAGYLTYTGTSGTSYVVSGLTGSWIGATWVYRGQQWIINKTPITNQSGTTLTTTAVGGPYPGVNGFGGFIQNAAATLDQNGEWFHNTSTNKIRIYYTSTPPTIQVATLSNAALVSGAYDNISFSDIDFTGYNGTGLSFANSDKLVFKRCNISLMGIDGISCPGGNLDTVMNCTISQIGSNGIRLDNSTNAYLGYNTIRQTALWLGLIGNGDGTGFVVKSEGAGVKAEYNNIINNGYLGLSLNGTGTITQYNFIDSFGRTKNDGAGIYVRNFALNSNALVDHNIVINGGGTIGWAKYGTSDSTYDPTMGIYLDEGTNNFTISNNTVYQVAMHGLFLNEGHDNAFTDNNVYTGISTSNYPRAWNLKNAFVNQGSPYVFTTQNLTITGNAWVVGLNTTILFGGQNLYTEEISDPSRIGATGTMNSNAFCRPMNEPTTLYVGSNISLAAFKSTYSKELASTISPTTISNVNDIRIVYNRTTSPVTTSLGATYYKLDGSTTSSVTVNGYESIILIKQ